MKKFTVISLAALLAATTFVGCNSSDYTPGENTASSVAVYSFSLSEDDKVLANLDTVFFSIDLNKAEIFNADSLPFGTRTDKLVPVIRTLDNVSRAELRVTRSNGTDTVFNYLENSTDTIDFSNPVLFTIASPNGDLTQTYTVKVNVHAVKSDSLVWGNTARTNLPSLLSAPTRQQTVSTLDATYCLTMSGDLWAMATRATAADEWEKYYVTVPQNANIGSFSASDDALYIVAGVNDLCKSTDGGRKWSSTGTKMNHIYGAYGTSLLGAVYDANEWYTTTYPSAERAPLPDGMPVGATSQLVRFSFPLSGSEITTFVGGYDADDRPVDASWGFDGSEWAKLSVAPLPEGFQDMTLVPYFSVKVSSTFIATRQSILMAFGGNNETGVNDTVYVSPDYGRTWSKASELMQLPAYMPRVFDAQAFVENITLHSRSGSEIWDEFEAAYRIPASAVFETGFEMPFSRATRPVEEWECPYIYLYGGYDERNVLSQSVWRGTINRFTFKPII